VERVLYAGKCLTDRRRFTRLSGTATDGPSLGKDLRDAIKVNVDNGMRRAIIRHCIDNTAPFGVHVSLLIGNDAGRICSGCPISMRCVMEGLSTPDTCYRAGIPTGVVTEERPNQDKPYIERNYQGHAYVVPLRLRGERVEVVCEHPRGTWALDINDLADL